MRHRPWSEQTIFEREFSRHFQDCQEHWPGYRERLAPDDAARFQAVLDAAPGLVEAIIWFRVDLQAAARAQDQRLAAAERAAQDSQLVSALAVDAPTLAEAESRRRARVATIRKLFDKTLPRVTAELDALAPSLARNARLVPLAAHLDDAGPDFARATEAVRASVETWSTTLRDLTARVEAAERDEPVNLADLERELSAVAAIAPDVIQARDALDRAEQALTRMLKPTPA